MNVIAENKIQEPKNIALDVFFVLAILLPFVWLSFYNHPIGDDFWFSALVRKYGFSKAAFIIFSTVSPRFSSLAVMGINPLIFGNFWLYKLIPVLFILSFFLVFSYFIQSVTVSAANRKYIFLLSAFFTVTYISILPGVGEGMYWVSSLVVYQFGNLFFLIWLAFLIRYFNRNSIWFYGPASTITLLILLGFNEMIAVIALLVNITILIFRKMSGRNTGIILINLALSVIVLYMMLRSGSVSVRYLSGDLPGGRQLFHYAWLACLKTGYHILKCIANPLFWVGITLAVPSMKYLFTYGGGRKISMIPVSRYTLTIWIFMMVLISLLATVFSPDHFVPLRVSNLIVFIFLMGLFYAAVFFLSEPGKNFIFKELLKWSKYRNACLLTLFVLAFFLRNDYSTGVREILSGSASAYDREMTNRILLIQHCTADTCTIPVLKHRPVSIRYSAYDNDRHIGEYFNKVLLYDGY
jgi:hypothetical protein